MSSESRRGLRIALCFTTAFVLAELLRVDLQLTFLAPLVAGALAVGPAVGTIRLIVLPISAWLLVALAGIAMQFLARVSLPKISSGVAQMGYPLAGMLDLLKCSAVSPLDCSDCRRRAKPRWHFSASNCLC